MKSAAEWLLAMLWDEDGWRDPNPGRDRVTGLQHALQAATRAEAEGADRDAVVVALLHDAGRPLNDEFHGHVIADIMLGRLPWEWTSALRHHGAFQADLLHGTKVAQGFNGMSWFDNAERLARWDAASFSPDYPHEPLQHFEPLVKEVFA